MKGFKILFLMLIATLAFAFTTVKQASAATPDGDKYPFGYKSDVELVSTADTIMLEPNNLSVLVATVDADTSLTIAADVSNSIVGDVIYLKVTADSTNRTVAFIDNITAITDTITAKTTEVFQFVYDGAAFIGVSVVQIE